MRRYTIDNFAQLIDHTNLQPDATRADMERLCDEAVRYHFRMVAINPVQSALCAELLAGTDVHVGAAIGFPLGQISVASKVFETRDALRAGANEIDYVVNLTEVKAGNWDYVTEEMAQVVAACREVGATSKVIFETCLLTDEEKLRLCDVASEVLPDFVKTSTGFSTGGATVEDVRLMRGRVDARVGVKAAGRIRSAQTFLSMVGAGATRVGATRSVTVIEELRALMEEAGTDYLEV
ncbi:deoxyribose-phosphate aldolase [Olsenella sp. An188]|uniref:deoxyribose-phosphate aldolase n=1 Tax=Olsenella sp. An188 TaxID=1965579 RepID=UPI000B39E04A|nr:deoxyribose-phosphate aldolase [Olsenella sp. An188]OUP38039.1 deoxyribose-phosphate aldolase [Olsenella sp. An188]